MGTLTSEKPNQRLGSVSVGARWYGLPAVAVYSMSFWNSDHPVGMILAPAAFGGVIGLAVTCYFASRAKYAPTAIDLFRIAGWTLIGAALGAICLGGYYPHFYPRAGRVVTLCARATVVLGVPAILLSAIAFPRRMPSPGKCSRCDYELRGLTEGRCPECGQRFDLQDESADSDQSKPGKPHP